MPSSTAHVRRALAALLLVPVLAACSAKTDAPASSGSTPAGPVSTAPGSSAPSGPASTTSTPTPSVTSTKNLTVNYFGDSFAVGGRPGLEKVFKEVTLFAKVSEQSDAVLADMRDHVADPVNVVVLHTGNNGTVSEETLRTTLKAYAKAPRVVVVLPHTPRSWTKEARELFVRVCGTPEKPLIANVRVVDWASAAQAHPEYLVRDGVHPSGKGIAAYTRLVQEAAVRA